MAHEGLLILDFSIDPCESLEFNRYHNVPSMHHSTELSPESTTLQPCTQSFRSNYTADSNASISRNKIIPNPPGIPTI